MEGRWGSVRFCCCCWVFVYFFVFVFLFFVFSLPNLSYCLLNLVTHCNQRIGTGSVLGSHLTVSPN